LRHTNNGGLAGSESIIDPENFRYPLSKTAGAQNSSES
jgi:hypothetical protein